MGGVLKARCAVALLASLAFAIVLGGCWVLEGEEIENVYEFGVIVEFIDERGQPATCDELGILQVEVVVHEYDSSGEATGCCVGESVLTLRTWVYEYNQSEVEASGYAADGSLVAHVDSTRHRDDHEILIQLGLRPMLGATTITCE